jgi:hypothetical protein
MVKKLRVPSALAVVVLAACGDDSAPGPDAGGRDAAIVDAGEIRDAACPMFSEYNDDAGRCVCEPFAPENPDTGLCFPIA